MRKKMNVHIGPSFPITQIAHIFTDCSKDESDDESSTYRPFT